MADELERRNGTNGAGVGGPARGYAWPPFAPGHTLSVRHGAYSGEPVLRTSERTREIVAKVAPHVPGFTDGATPSLEVYAVALRRIELAVAALEDAEPGELRRLEQDARGWANVALRYAQELGLTPAAHARIVRDVGIGQDAGVRAAHALEEYVVERYSESGGQQ